MEFEFMSADTVLPPCMPLPAAMLRLPISSTAKVMYARLLNTTLTAGIEDSNGILFVRFPIMELAAAPLPQPRHCEAFPERIGGHRAYPAGAPGCGRTKPHLHAASQRRAAMINEKLEKLNQEIAKGEARLRRAQHEEKILEHQVKQLTRKERTHRLCTRGAMLESFLLRPEVLTDEDVMDILKQAFSQSGMKEIVAESVKGRVAGESLPE